jgi:DNA invertase Pin-like site-specific DNA recombinase
MHPATSRAAIYVRMSTDSQDYSTDHQREKIREYARNQSIEIVREYADEGKSGLDIKRRAGLLQLIQDVQSQQTDFGLIIVYDVSRWGRFQDIDEAAYHEHTCRRAGIEVVYCGEKFVGESGPYASLMKSMKRVMAAEYSRELSGKVFLAQSRFIQLGFKQGGHAGFGLRRLALKACGTPRAYLEYRESKAALTDRVVLVWGPDNEVETVRRIYALYLDQKLSIFSIVDLLNKEQIPSEFGRPWTQHMLRSILTNVKYCGTLAYNRRSCKLSAARSKNAHEQWVLNTSAIDPIISPALFDRAQAERAQRTDRYTRAELISLLQACHTEHGKVSSNIIAANPAMPDPQLFARAFGSLVAAYDAAELPRRLTYAFAATRASALVKRTELFCLVEKLARDAGAAVEKTPEPFTLRLNDKLKLRVDVAICRTPRRGQRNWKLVTALEVNFILTGRLDFEGLDFIDYFLVTPIQGPSATIYLREANLQQFSQLRHASVESLFGRETPVPEYVETLADTGGSDVLC